jgi:hypothetical protein
MPIVNVRLTYDDNVFYQLYSYVLYTLAMNQLDTSDGLYVGMLMVWLVKGAKIPAIRVVRGCFGRKLNLGEAKRIVDLMFNMHEEIKTDVLMGSLSP